MVFDINARYLACVAAEPILFLDLDNVLHPGGPRPDWPAEESAPGALLPRLLRILNDFPEVDVVVSSTWRQAPGALETEVPEALRRRIVGVTPEIKRSELSNYPAGYVPEPIRHREILKYLEETRQQGRPWVALDADATLFPADCPGLILCPHGFRAEQEVQLRELLTTRRV